MDTLSHFYKDITFNNIMKAHFRKYLDKEYKEASIVEIDRNLIDEDNLVIHRIHTNKYIFKTIHLVEKIKINRKLKTYESSIHNYLYTENCKYFENSKGVDYIQNYSAPSIFKKKKEEVFKIGIQVIDNIINNLQLRNEISI